MAAINQAEIIEALQTLGNVQDKSEFIFGFMSAYGYPKATITQLRNGHSRNVANDKTAGEIALKKGLYFKPVTPGESIFDTADHLASSDVVRSNAIRFVIVTDFTDLVALDLRADDRLEVALPDLYRQYGFFLPLAGHEKYVGHAENPADIKAAEKMGRLFDLIRERNDLTKPEDIHALNVFLTRLLFCFFAESTGIFAEQQFTNTIRSFTREDGSDVDQFFSDLFMMLNTETNSPLRTSKPAHLTAFPYVNGGLFQTDEPIPEFGAKARRLLLECGALIWSEINPDIFGSMFQAVIEEDQRGNLGQHYTSVSNIMKVIQPLFLDKLHADFEQARNSSKDSDKKLKALLVRIGKIKVFDPACGSGNFLIIAYKELRKFEIEVIRCLNAVSKQSELFSSIRLTQFYGIEIDDFAHEIATLSLWLAEHQMNQVFEAEFGHKEPMLPLKASGHIARKNSLRINWDNVCPKTADDEVYVLGNPPFLGYNSRSEAQKKDMELIFHNFKKFKDLDYVACWFWLGANYIKGSKAEIAFVSTNSICQGEQVALLWPRILELDVSLHIAYQPFPWKNNARLNAGVHVTVIGLSQYPRIKSICRNLDGDWHYQTVSSISPYLLEGKDVVVISRTSPLSDVPKMIRGSQPSDGGHLLLNQYEYDELITTAPACSKWLRRIYGADEFINSKRRWCLWLDDNDLKEARDIRPIYQRLDSVSESRLKSTNAQTRALAASPHLFWQNNQPKSGHYIIIPNVSSERREYVPIGFLDSSAIATNLASIVPHAGLYELGILCSTMHNDWMRTVGGRLKSDYRYSTGLVYNTFPWPDSSDSDRRRIEKLAEEILLIREDYPDKTLADLYDPDKMPEPLKTAHKALDATVEKLYRRAPFRDSTERLEHLFARYEKLIRNEQQQSLKPTPKKPSVPRNKKLDALTAEDL